MNFNINFQNIAFKLTPVDLRKTKFLSYIYSIIKPLRDLNYGVSISDYSVATTYAIGDKTRYNNIYYLCRIAITVPEIFDETKWVSLGMWNNFYNLTEKIDLLLTYNSKQLTFEKYLNWKYDNTLSDFDSYNCINDTYSKDGALLTNANNKPRIQVLTSTTTIKYLYNTIESHAPIYFYNNWNSLASYIINDRCQYLNNIYVCILGHSNKIPTDPIYWTFQKTVDYYYNKGGGILSSNFIVRVPITLLGTKETEFNSDIKKYKIAGKTYTIVKY
jgi:hypothetical protein